MKLVKDGKEDFIQGGLATTMGFVEGREIRLNSEYSKESGIYSQGAGWWSVDGKLLRGSIRGRGFLLKAGQGDQTSLGDAGGRR